ncbi:MAG: FHA domain-containing protein [Ruminococcaceae bacterium]|nr:FHA domain-containing protein [Oscillospiraceae bacterium]
MMQQCPNGHLYDDAKNSSCPYCNASPDPMMSTMPVGGIDSMPPVGMVMEDGMTPTEAIGSPAGGGFPITEPLDPGFRKTEPIYKNEKDIVPITGWLVCLEGEKRGEDFKIRGEQTTIGRGPENAIQLDFDDKISMGANAIIAYDRRNNKFFIYQKENRNNIYVNNSLLLVPVEIHDYDVIEIGETKMLFRSFCNDQFVWSENKKN